MKKQIAMRLNEALMNDIRAFAKKDHRSTTGMVEYILYQYRDQRNKSEKPNA